MMLLRNLHKVLKFIYSDCACNKRAKIKIITSLKDLCASGYSDVINKELFANMVHIIQALL